MQPGYATSDGTEKDDDDQRMFHNAELDDEEMHNIENAVLEADGPLEITDESIYTEVE